MASFTPSSAIDPSKERDWAAQLGMLDWDSTNIVFTKRTLLEFLKYAGVTVDTNFTNIQKLPRYAQFGKISGEVSSVQSSADTSPGPSAAALTAVSDFKPTRRVRDPPGGVTHNIFGNGHEADDGALAGAPSKPSAAGASPATEFKPEGETADESNNRPRAKHTNSSGVGGLWAASDDAEEFKPTRRVRERPGGKDSISELF
ncbi:hypothetical protein C8Q74DRAFT_1225371 [Fomes fomentarius]|nr:hypothetical protein C8Q74DRAFT_1225371 [Fomes fomentarius]